ncbi:glutamate carboxypeptidase 2-like [Bolinopsis microptera]|uniref:glutamate carboxypeptidase 2-like n=1 Tax=Bolinopsis microptera TaxID=2820187 RepID=UPI0030792EE7
MEKSSQTLLVVVLLVVAGQIDSRNLGEVDLSNEEAMSQLLDQIDATRIGNFIENMTLHPRNTQSDWMGEKEETVKQMFKDFGMDVITKKYKVLQCFPKDVDPSLTEVLNAAGDVVETYREDGNKAERILPAFNAWSKSGTVEGEPVYVNYGRKEDYDYLTKDLGMDLTGKIAIARYGKIYRGDKSKFAKQNGMIGVIIYMDAKDYAPEGVDRMPDGPALPETGIQRGTLKDGLGDPSTYLYPSTKYAYHDSPEEYQSRLPGIVVMPINFKNALPLLASLDGDEVKDEWQGAGSETLLKYKYGPGFKNGSNKKKLRITVNLEYRMVEIENIFGVIKGQQEPDRWVMMGNHRDTWVHGAVDATTGLAALNEIGHGLFKLREQGWKPRRTIVLASWGAEEQGIIGSTEFVEDYMTLLQEKMVAYINVDVAASDQKYFKPSATPNFRPLLERAAKQAGAPLDSTYGTFYEQWDTLTKEEHPELTAPKIGDLGSGSDYAAFINMAGVSCIDLTIVGPYYTYHTEYDNYHYLSNYADPGMKGTKAVAEVAAVILLELASEKLVPLDASSYSNYVNNKISSSTLEEDLAANDIDYGILKKSLAKFVENAREYEDSRSKLLEDKSRKQMDMRRFNDQMLQMERSFIYPPGLPNRPQNRHILIAPSILNSYSGSVFPGLFDSLTLAKEIDTDENWNQVKKQLTIAAWVTKAAARSLSSEVFPN